MKKLVLFLLLVLTQASYSQWEPCNKGLNGGNVQCIEINDAFMFAGTKSGIFLSTNKGDSWTAKNAGLINADVRAIIIEGSKIIIGTNGGGVYLSTNNGDSWTAKNNGLTNRMVYALAYKENYIFAGTAENGFFVSTDNGESWTAKNIDSTKTSGIVTIAIKDGNIFAGHAAKGIFYSTDNGDSWTAKNSGLLDDIPIIKIVISNNNLFAGTRTTIYQSTDNGDSWIRKNNASTVITLQSIAVSNNNIYLLRGNLLCSSDNGDNWTSIGQGISNKRILTITSNGDDLFIGSESGVYHTTNNGSSWVEKNSGLESALIRSLLISDKIIFAGTNGNGAFLSTDRGDSWIEKNQGFDTTFTGISYIMSLSQIGNDILAGTDGNGMYLSSDNGNSWTRRWIEWSVEELTQGTRYDVSAIAVKDDIIFTGTTSGLYTSTDKGLNWTKNDNASLKRIMLFTQYGNDIFAGTAKGLFLFSPNTGYWDVKKDNILNMPVIMSIAINSDNIFVGTENMGIFVSDNYGVNWSRINAGLTDDSYDIYSLAFIGDYIFAGTSGGVYLSTDEGEHWTKKNIGLTLTNIRTLSIKGDDIYAGTWGGGLFRSKITELITGIDISNEQNPLSISPNPASDFITITLRDGLQSFVKNDDIVIYSAFGVRIMELTGNANLTNGSLRIDVNSLATGVYFVKIGNQAAKFIKL